MSTGNRLEDRVAVIAGMPRAATTFLYHTLAEHPKLFVPSRKELEFFSLNYRRGTDWYLDHFRRKSDDQTALDISPIYLLDKNAPKRLKAFNPAIRVVLILRDPADFAISFFKNRMATTFQHISFPTFLDGHVYRKDGQALELAFRENEIADRIQVYRETFAGNLLLCDYRGIERDPLTVLRALEVFLRVPAHFDSENFENVRINAGDQRNIKVVNKLMHQKWFADLVTKVFPKRLIMAVRYWLQSSAGKRSAVQLSAEDGEYAKRRFAADAAYIRELFAEAPMVTGDGVAFWPAREGF